MLEGYQILGAYNILGGQKILGGSQKTTLGGSQKFGRKNRMIFLNNIAIRKF